MKLRLVMRTCANEDVARAALRSIGGEIAGRVELEATRRGCSIGRYVAEAVRSFEHGSDLATWGRAEQATRGADQPILAGLYYILDYSLRHLTGADRRTDAESRQTQPDAA